MFAELSAWISSYGIRPIALAALLLGLSVLILYRFRPHIRVHAQLQIPPGRHWLWGHEKAAAYDETAGAFYSRYAREYGPAYVISGALGFGDILVVADPEALAHIFLRQPFNYAKGPVMRRFLERLIGKSLVWVEGADNHTRMRRFISPCFTAQQVKNNSTVITAAVQRYIEKLETYVRARERDKDGKVAVDLLQWTWRVTLDVIGQVGFNHDFECGESQDAKDIASVWHKQVVLAMSFSGFIAPLVIRKFPWIAELPFKAIQAQGEVKRIVKDIGRKFVESENGSVDGQDLLSVLIRENIKAATSERETTDQLLDHICTFVLAGHETVTGALNYTLWELARNPAVQDKLRDEVQRFDGQPTYDDFQTSRLEYLDAVTKEILRIHTPGSHSERVALKDDVIPLRLPVYGKDGNVISAIPIKVGQLLYIPSITAHTLDSVWGDGDVFRPERWLPPNKLPLDDMLHKGWGKTFAFLQGPRNCIGTRFAIYEYKVILTELIRKFMFHDTGVALHDVFLGTIQPRVVGRESEGPAMPCGISRLRGAKARSVVVDDAAIGRSSIRL